jgi:hypothetical protein
MKKPPRGRLVPIARRLDRQSKPATPALVVLLLPGGVERVECHRVEM